jgi:branched-chain amino acid transport system substrate-binding protein
LGRDLKVVGVFPLSGPGISADGQEMRNGTVLAVDELNQLGGIAGRKVAFEEIDDGSSSTEEVVTAFRRAVDKQPDAIFSGYHIGTGPEFDLVADAGRLYFNVNTQERWTDLYRKNPDKYWSIFQCDPNDTWYGVGFALWLARMVDAGKFRARGKTFAILSGDDAYDRTIADTFEAKMRGLGWSPAAARQSFSVGKVADFAPMLARVRDNPPAVLFTTTFSPSDNAKMIQQFRTKPLDCLVYQQYGPSVPEYLELAGEAAEGVLWSTVLGVLPDERGQDFRRRYQARFGKAPGWSNAGGCYDQVMAWAKAAALAGDPGDYRKVAAAAERLVHRGVTGSLSFENHAGRQYPDQTKDPSLGQPHIIVQIQDRKHQIISPAPYHGGDFRLPSWFRA